VTPQLGASDTGLIVIHGRGESAIGQAYDDNGTSVPPGGTTGCNIRDVYLFNTAINADAFTTARE